jgi:hypothetical protein
MMRLPAQLIAAGVMGLLAAAPAAAQEPVMGGTLFSTQSTPFSWTLLGGPTNVSWNVNLNYSTGPGPEDLGSAGGFSYSPNGLFASSDGRGSPYSFGTPLFPSVPSGTNLILESNTGASLKTKLDRLHTGMTDFKYLTQPDQPTAYPINVLPYAAVFYGPDNTAHVGFALTGDGPFPTSFDAYPIRLSLSNVSATLGGGGAPGGGVGQVPEPEMWVLTLAGLLGAGLLRRRKR